MSKSPDTPKSLQSQDNQSKLWTPGQAYINEISELREKFREEKEKTRADILEDEKQKLRSQGKQQLSVLLFYNFV